MQERVSGCVSQTSRLQNNAVVARILYSPDSLLCKAAIKKDFLVPIIRDADRTNSLFTVMATNEYRLTRFGV